MGREVSSLRVRSPEKGGGGAWTKDRLEGANLRGSSWVGQGGLLS